MHSQGKVALTPSHEGVRFVQPAKSEITFVHWQGSSGMWQLLPGMKISIAMRQQNAHRDSGGG